ncbi:hypothetical protein NQ318_004021 [Aromia moschata]|uniref:Peptidase S1 domain-containing protein n=1 Tax=Aromia moschata TaxID=1265417 RepID=A0AAV8Z7W8_9CUCU|nr:hypothetical protein NQ318_004021 [Aromia moschata]
MLNIDVFPGGETANLGQFPWMALLGYTQRFVDFVEYLCGGTIITETYVLTAAHCLTIEINRQLVSVRLGEHDLQSDKDCETIDKYTICADDPVDIPVENYTMHPDYDPVKLRNDIALVRVKEKIRFTSYIQPICLPFERHLRDRDMTNQVFTISGWGKTQSRKLGGSPTLQFAAVRVWDQSECNKVIPPETPNCVQIVKDRTPAKVIAGGPLTNATLDLDEELRNFQVGIVSFASTRTCGVEELPPIYTRIDAFLEWIAENVT